MALLPFALNASTQFISPTKTPEYLAAGCRVVSTAVRDVVRPYGDIGVLLAHLPRDVKRAFGRVKVDLEHQDRERGLDPLRGGRAGAGNGRDFSQRRGAEDVARPDQVVGMPL